MYILRSLRLVSTALACAGAAFGCGGLPQGPTGGPPQLASDQVGSGSGMLSAVPAWSAPRSVGGSPTRFLAGGLRFEVSGDQVEVALDAVTTTLTEAVQTPNGWLYFSHDEQRVWRAETFLGELEQFQVAPEGLSLSAADDVGLMARGQENALLVLVGSDGRLYTTDGRTPLRPVAALNDYFLERGAIHGTEGVAIEAGGLFLVSHDGGNDWQIAAQPSSPPSTRERVEALGWEVREPYRVSQELVQRMAAAALTGFPLLRSNFQSAGVSVVELGDGSLLVANHPSAFLVGANGQFLAADPPDGCVLGVPQTAWCNDELRVFDPSARRWTPLFRASVEPRILRNHEYLLVDRGCQGQEGQVCRIDRATLVPTTIPRMLDLRAQGLRGDELVSLRPSDIVRVNIETGESSNTPIDVVADGPELARTHLLEDGSVLVEILVEDEGSISDELTLHRAHLVSQGGAVTEVGFPPGTRELGMGDQSLGLAHDGEQLSFTIDGGSTWATVAEHPYESEGWAIDCGGGRCTAGPFVVHRGDTQSRIHAPLPSGRSSGPLLSCVNRPRSSNTAPILLHAEASPGGLRATASWSGGDTRRDRAHGEIGLPDGSRPHDSTFTLVAGTDSLLLARLCDRRCPAWLGVRGGGFSELPIPSNGWFLTLRTGGIALADRERFVQVEASGRVRQSESGPAYYHTGLIEHPNGRLDRLYVGEDQQAQSLRIGIIGEGNDRSARELSLAEALRTPCAESPTGSPPSRAGERILLSYSRIDVMLDGTPSTLRFNMGLVVRSEASSACVERVGYDPGTDRLGHANGWLQANNGELVGELLNDLSELEPVRCGPPNVSTR